MYWSSKMHGPRWGSLCLHTQKQLYTYVLMLSPAYIVARIYTCRPHSARCSHTQREPLQGLFWNQEDGGLPRGVLNAGSSHSTVYGTKELSSQDLNNSKKNIDPILLILLLSQKTGAFKYVFRLFFWGEWKRKKGKGSLALWKWTKE